MLSCAQPPPARMPTWDWSQTVPSSDPIQPSRQSVVPVGLRLAAPERPPKAPARVNRPAAGPRPPRDARDGGGGWGRGAAGGGGGRGAGGKGVQRGKKTRSGEDTSEIPAPSKLPRPPFLL